MSNPNETQTTAAPTVMKRESRDPKYPWRQYLIVRDRAVTVVEMTPAPLGGWNFGRISFQGEADWPGYSKEQIVAWKLQTDDRAELVTDERVIAQVTARAEAA